MARFPYFPLAAIVASFVSQQVVQMSVFAYAPFMVQFMGVVDDSDEAGEMSVGGSSLAGFDFVVITSQLRQIVDGFPACPSASFRVDALRPDM